MTQVDFHSNVADKLHYTCRLVRKARAAECRIVILNSDVAQLESLNQALWAFSATDFLPHVFVNDALALQTPIILTNNEIDTLPHHDLLINLNQSMPQHYVQFERVIEIVSSEEQDAQCGRERFRQYQQQGIKPSHTVTKTS